MATKKTKTPAVTGDALVLGVYAGEKRSELTAGAKTAAKDCPVLKTLADAGELKTGAGDVTVIYYPEGLGYRRLVVAGLGKAEKLTLDVVGKIVTAAVKAADAEDIDFNVSDWDVADVDSADFLRYVARTALLAGRPEETLKSTPTKGKTLAGIGFIDSDEDEAAAMLAAAKAEADAVAWAKRLAELPSNALTPEILADTVETLADETKGLEAVVWDWEDIREQMAGLTAVGIGSDNLPVFIELNYRGAGDAKPYVLVGKGVTFDAGGISLKPARGMDEMKFDMSGAAVVLAAVKYAADMKLPINVTALVPACENLPSGGAVKPGDVIRYDNGKTVEILNTDAEGRLILADALLRADALNPATVIDVATLTGACIVALGHDMSGLFTEDAALQDDLRYAADAAGDAVWPMPVNDEFRAMLKSAAADLANIGPAGCAGASTAAAFLSEFAPSSCPWAHLDVAGTANTHSGLKHSTGRPLPLLMNWLNLKAFDRPTPDVVVTKRGTK